MVPMQIFIWSSFITTVKGKVAFRAFFSHGRYLHGLVEFLDTGYLSILSSEKTTCIPKEFGTMEVGA